MSKVIEDENGNEITVFTQEELTAKEAAIKAEYETKLADKDKHVSDKLDEFTKGRQAQELKDAERDTKIAEAKAAADTATAKAVDAETRRSTAVKEGAMKKFVGDNAEAKAKFDESFAMIALEIKEDADILKKVELAATMAGLNSNMGPMGDMPLSGGYAPTLTPEAKAKKESEHNDFLQATGLGDFIPKPEENK